MEGGHLPTEPDYWKAGVCQRCGEEVLPKWTPELELYGIDCFVPAGTDAFISSECYDNADAECQIEFRVTDWGRTDAASAGFPVREGYECLYVNFDVNCTDENAQRWGANFYTICDDYFDSTLMNNTAVGEFYAEGYSYEVPWNGSRWHAWARGEQTIERLTGRARLNHFTFYFQVPEGYDGCVIGITRPHYDLPNNYLFTYAHEDTVLFRLSD